MKQTAGTLLALLFASYALLALIVKSPAPEEPKVFEFGLRYRVPHR